MSRREFVSRFYRSEDDYTKQIENSLKGGESYLNLSDEINFDSQNNKASTRNISSQLPSQVYHNLNDRRETQSVQSNEIPVVSIESPGYTQTSFKDQIPKERGCGLSHALRRLKNKLICKSNKDSLDQTFAYDPYKSLTPNQTLT
jgi:hypothetical protein